ncbi:MAG: hypothetical protein NXI31_09995 [bacterium]|nr:hypothetical protein [bacterium]
MNRTDGNQTPGDLPDFLDEGTEPSQTPANELYSEDASAIADGDDDRAEPADEADYDDDGYVEDDYPRDESFDDGDAQDTSASAPAAVRRGRSRRTRNDATNAPGGGLATVVGIVLLGAGVVLGLLPDVAAQAAPYGLTPATLAVLGGIALAVGCLRRSVRTMQTNLAGEHQRELDDLHARIEGLAVQQPTGSPENTDNSEQILFALQKQDEKTNNLTKAIKMYGKPLVDIANHGTELAATLAQVKTSVEAGGDSARAAWSRLETQIKKSGGEALQEQIGRFEVAIQAMSQRLEDSAKSLIRLEDHATGANDHLEVLSRGESVEVATKALGARLDEATSNLQGCVTELRDGHLGELENTVRDIQREVATVATSVSQIQATLKSGAVARPAPAPTQAAPAPSPAAVGAGGAPAPATPAPATGDDDDAAGYATGARRSKGKNVLGAIAKLKQMKG